MITLFCSLTVLSALTHAIDRKGSVGSIALLTVSVANLAVMAAV